MLDQHPFLVLCARLHVKLSSSVAAIVRISRQPLQLVHPDPEIIVVCPQELKSKMVYTIIRPGGLKSEPGTGSGVLTADTSVCGAIHREDVAGLLVKALFSSATDNKVQHPPINHCQLLCVFLPQLHDMLLYGYSMLCMLHAQ